MLARSTMAGMPFSSSRETSASPVPRLSISFSESRFGLGRKELAYKVDTHALGTDQLHQLHDLLQEGLRRVLEEQMGFVEEEHRLGLLRVAHFGQALEQL